eukprot:PhF_6_TR7338/c0_g1_i1/m.11027
MIQTVAATLFPALFMFHGGGPLPVLGDPAHAELVKGLKAQAASLPFRPKAIVCVSAHYESDLPEIGGASKPSMIYDYGGFPAESYRLQYPAPGSPDLAKKIEALMKARGLPVKINPTRGYDHGVFVPLMVMFPEADIPVIPISILSNQDAAAHILLGEALAPLREEGVFIIGSGASFHNFRTNSKSTADSITFDNALTEALCNDMTPEQRREKLSQWTSFPKAYECQPRGAADHLMPLFVVAGAAGLAKAEKTGAYEFTFLPIWNGVRISDFAWK